MNCKLCHKKILDEMGKSCKACGMVLKDKSRDFCSRQCREKYVKAEEKEENFEFQISS